MKYSKRESLELAKVRLAKELKEATAALGQMDDEAAAARAKLEKHNREIAGRVLYRHMREEWDKDPDREAADKAALAAKLVNARERKAFGLPPLRRAGDGDSSSSAAVPA